jgi:hypothetical protein
MFVANVLTDRIGAVLFLWPAAYKVAYTVGVRPPYHVHLWRACFPLADCDPPLLLLLLPLPLLLLADAPTHLPAKACHQMTLRHFLRTPSTATPTQQLQTAAATAVLQLQLLLTPICSAVKATPATYVATVQLATPG